MVLGILLTAASAFYLALVVASRIEAIFFPGSTLHLGGVAAKLPGIATGDSTPDVSGGRINILVLGLDSRPADGIFGNTDTSFVVSIDPSTKTARGLAVPRDLWVDIPSASGNSTFKDRINTAYNYGEVRQPGSGPALAEKVFSQVLGIKIDHYAIINFDGFKQLVDSLGGIDVDVPTKINDPYYSETEKLGDYYPCVFSVGVHHMNGSDALCYSRTRYNNSDLDRILRQQRVMYAVLDKAKQLNVLSNPGTLVSLWKQYKGLVKTDINDLQIPGYAHLASQIDTTSVSFLSLGPAMTDYITPGGAEVLLGSQSGIRQIVDAFMSDYQIEAEAAKVELINGTGSTDEASLATDFLTSLGIQKSSIVTGESSAALPQTQVIDFSGKNYTADRIAGWLGISKDNVRQAGESDASLRQPGADIVVLLGSDAQLNTRGSVSSQAEFTP